MENAKVYNVCLERVKFQVGNARKRLNGGVPPGGRLILESYNSGEFDDIVDILEIYDIKERTEECLREKLDDLAYTVSVLVNEKVCFDYNDGGDLCLYLLIADSCEEKFTEMAMTLAAAS